jgi:hypothetical protein
LRGDALGHMYARHQISEPQFQAGRRYQEHHDNAELGSIRSINLEKTRVSGGQFPEPVTERQRRAADKLRKIEGELRHHEGITGVWLARVILAERHSPEAAARMAGAAGQREVRSWCWLFRRCLNTIAVATGLMSSTRKPYRPIYVDGQDPALDADRQARDAELVDPALRSGRPGS